MKLFLKYAGDEPPRNIPNIGTTSCKTFCEQLRVACIVSDEFIDLQLSCYFNKCYKWRFFDIIKKVAAGAHKDGALLPYLREIRKYCYNGALKIIYQMLDCESLCFIMFRTFWSGDGLRRAEIITNHVRNCGRHCLVAAAAEYKN